MAINFPSSPVDGNTYDYLGIRFTFDGTTSPGFWKIVTPGNTSAATPAEIDTGTDNAKMVTPFGLNGSDYARKTSPALTGIPTAPTAAPATNTTQLATTAYVIAAIPAPVEAIPSGTSMLFMQAAAPTGWTKSVTHNNKALRIVSGTGGGSGGTVDFSTAFASKSVAGTIANKTAGKWFVFAFEKLQI